MQFPDAGSVHPLTTTETKNVPQNRHACRTTWTFSARKRTKIEEDRKEKKEERATGLEELNLLLTIIILSVRKESEHLNRRRGDRVR